MRHLQPFARISVPFTHTSVPVSLIQDEVNRLFNDFFSDNSPTTAIANTQGALSITPAIDVSESDKDYTIAVELPGLESQDVNITLNDGYVTIKGEKKQEIKDERQGFFRQERTYGAFQRVVALPETADFETAEAGFKNGVLTITVPKKVEVKSSHRTLEIKQSA